MSGLTPLAAFGARDLRWYGAKGDGSTDDTAAFQAAYDALPDVGASNLPGGGTIIVPPGRYPIGQITLDRRKPVTIKALGRPQHKFIEPQKTQPGVATIIGLDTGDDSRVFSITDGTGVNGYGFAFENLNFDLSVGTQYAIYAENTSNVRVDNCAAASITSPPRMQWLVRALSLGGASDDSSWWRISENYSRNCGLAYIGFTGRNHHNHNVLSDNICFPGNQVDACIKLIYGNRNVTLNNNLEPASDIQAVGLYLDHVWGGSHIGDAGESVSGSTFYFVRSSNNNLLMPAGISVTTGAKLIDERYSTNLLLTGRGGVGGTNDYTTDGFVGSRLFGMSGDGLVGTLLSHIPGSLRSGQFSLVEDATDLVPLGNVTAQYMNDGTGAYTTWTPANLQDVRYPNSDGPTITSAEDWCTFTVGPTPAVDWPLLVVTLESSFSLPTGATINVYTKDAGTGTTTATRSWFVADGTTMRGFSLQLPTISAASNIQIEFRVSNWPVGGTIKVTRIQLFSTLQNTTKSGAVMRGPGTPEGAVKAQVGTMFLRTDGGANTTLYIKESGAGTNTGWVAK